jgi:pyridoxal phosphate enzyme (YggS family)
LSDIDERVARVRRRIATAARRAGRDPEGITLVAVGKTFPADACKAVLDAGIADLGENRAQELRDKAAVLNRGVRWHFVGHLQTNKVRFVVGTAILIHSVDRYGLAEAVSRRAAAIGVAQDVLIEVNLSGERSKHGVEPARAPALAVEVAALEAIRLRGLMAIPPPPEDPEDSRRFFKQLASLRDDIAVTVPGARELSMGMTRDLDVAVEEGATIVRVGEAIFGPRPAAKLKRPV